MLVILAATAIEALLLPQKKWLAPFVGTSGPLLVDSGVLCAGDPPVMPDWTKEDLIEVYQGNVLAKVKQTVEHLAWYQFCQCRDAPTPAPPLIPPPAGLPQLPSGPVETCDQLHGEYARAPGQPFNNVPVIPPVAGLQPIVQGATAVSITAQITVRPPGVGELLRNVFTVSFHDAAGVLLAGTLTLDCDPLVNSGVVTISNSVLPANTAQVAVTQTCQPGGSCQTGRVAIIDLAFHCGSLPGRLQPECCPPDPTLIGKLDRLLLQMALVVSRLGPSVPLEVISTSPISGEGQLPLAQGARQIKFLLSTLGPGVQTVPYAFPDRVMRAATMRFGNDFGWQRRQHLDAQEILFSVPLDSQVVSWSLSPGTSGSLIQLGQLL